MLPFLKLFDLCPGWVWALMLVGAVFGMYVERDLLRTERAEHAQTQLDFSDYRGRVEQRENIRSQAALLEVGKQRDLEKLRRTATQKAQDDLIAESSRNAVAARAADTRRGLLNETIDRITAPGAAGGQASGNSAALRRAEETAPTLGRLLKACRAESDSDAGELEQLAGQVRGLITQYRGLQASLPATGAQPGD